MTAPQFLKVAITGFLIGLAVGARFYAAFDRGLGPDYQAMFTSCQADWNLMYPAPVKSTKPTFQRRSR